MIGTADYRFLTEVIAEGHDAGSFALRALEGARTTIDLIEVNRNDANKQRLEGFIESTYQFVIFKHLPWQRPLLSAVRALNEHVLAQYKVDTIDEFLTEQFLEVPLTFAQISNYFNYNINNIGTKAARWQDINNNWEDLNSLTWDKIGWTNIC